MIWHGLLVLLIMIATVTGIAILSWGLDPAERRERRCDRARRGIRADLRSALRDRR